MERNGLAGDGRQVVERRLKESEQIQSRVKGEQAIRGVDGSNCCSLDGFYLESSMG